MFLARSKPAAKRGAPLLLFQASLAEDGFCVGWTQLNSCELCLEHVWNSFFWGLEVIGEAMFFSVHGP